MKSWKPHIKRLFPRMPSAARIGATFAAGFLISTVPGTAHATNFSVIASNISKSIQDFPGLIASAAYLLGLLLGVLGVLKIRDHVEDPRQAQLKEGVIRLVVGGGLFALPMVFSAMENTIGQADLGVAPPALSRASLGVMD